MVIVDYDLVQGTPEWLEARKNKITATDSFDLLNGLSPAEILERKQNTSFSGNAITARGHELETQARALYATIYNTPVGEAGLVTNSEYPDCAMSPDGLVGEDGLIEIKSFLKKHHEDVIEHLDAHLLAQINFQLLISGRKWVDFVAYNPEEEDLDKSFVVKRIFPDPEIQAKLKEAIFAAPAEEDVEQTALVIAKLETDVLAYEDQFAQVLTDYQNKKSRLEELRERLKTQTTGKVSKTVEFGGNKLSVSIYDSHRLACTEPSQVAEEFTSKEEIPDAFVENGVVYRKVPNIKLVQNLVKAGKSLPEGFVDKVSRTIRLTFNGKSI